MLQAGMAYLNNRDYGIVSTSRSGRNSEKHYFTTANRPPRLLLRAKIPSIEEGILEQRRRGGVVSRRYEMKCYLITSIHTKRGITRAPSEVRYNPCSIRKHLSRQSEIFIIVPLKKCALLVFLAFAFCDFLLSNSFQLFF